MSSVCVGELRKAREDVADVDVHRVPGPRPHRALGCQVHRRRPRLPLLRRGYDSLQVPPQVRLLRTGAGRGKLFFMIKVHFFGNKLCYSRFRQLYLINSKYSHWGVGDFPNSEIPLCFFLGVHCVILKLNRKYLAGRT